MKALVTLLCLCSCAGPQYDVTRAINAATPNATMRQYLATIPVTFVPGSVDEHCPPGLRSDMTVEHYPACFVVDHGAPHIWVSTIDLYAPSGAAQFRYEMAIQDSLDEEYGHAVQAASTCGRTWHPVVPDTAGTP